MADLVTTIKVNSKQFDNSIKSSTNQVRQFERENYKTGKQVKEFEGKISGIAKGALTGLVGTLGLAYGTMETFKGVITSTQTTSDAFDKVLAQTKGTVDLFFQSIAQGDFSGFINGIDGAIRRAGDLVQIMDELGDRIAGYDDKSSDIKMKITENRALIQDADTPEGRRKELLEENIKLIEELARATASVNSTTEDKVRKQIGAKAQLDNVTDEEVEVYLQEVSLNLDNDEFNKYVSDRAALVYRSEQVDNTTTISGDQITKSSRPTQDALNAEKELEELKAKNVELERLYKIYKLVMDDERIAVVNDRKAIRARQSDIANLRRQNSRDKRRNYGGSGKGDDEFLEGSLADIDNQIKALNKEISLSINDTERRKLYQDIEELNKKKVFIEVIYKGDIKPVASTNLGAESNTSVQRGIDALGSKKGIAIPDMEAPLSSMQIWNQTMNKIREDNWGAIESFNGIAQSMSAIGTASEGSAAAMFQWAATTLSTIAQAIPAINALIAVKEVEAQTSAKAAAAGAASSVAGIPIVGGILAVSAIASVVAAMASIPKFADGGLVYGNTIAQVGEYAGASNNPEVIAPLSKLRKILADTNEGNGGGTVEFKIAGKDLVGTINNYSSKQRKK